MKLNMAKALIRGAMDGSNTRDIAYSLCHTSQGLVELFAKAKEKSMGAVLKNVGVVRSVKLDGWSLPDAVWTAICCLQPNLNCYPLGEIAERVTKKVVVSLILNNTDKLNDLSESEMKRRFSLHGQEEILRCFLTHYFFEVGIDYMRRPGVLNRGYNLSKADRMVSLAAERNLRDTLAKECKASAEKFLPFQLEALSKKSLTIAPQQIKEGFVEVFGEAPPEVDNGQTQNENLVNIIVGTRSASDIKKPCTLGENAIRFLLYAKNPNVAVSFDTLKQCHTSKNDKKSRSDHPHSLVKDLVDLGVAVYMSDLHTERGRELARRLSIYMPVRHPERWSDAKKEVERTVASLGRDDVHIHFDKRRDITTKSDEFRLKSDRCVCLFSGGLDSLAGAVWALDNELKPVFVSHYGRPQLANLQNSLINELREIYGELQHHCFRVTRSPRKNAKYHLSSPLDSIMPQHLRSFLFLSLASAVALEIGTKKVYMFENGPIALNPLFSEARVNTHTAHPHFLGLFQKMLESVFNVQLHIKNPFIYMTKGEVANILARSELRKLVKATNSCWNWARVPVVAKNLGIKWRGESHDGSCLPCVVRRAAIYNAGLWTTDVKYLTDIFRNYQIGGRRGEAFIALTDYLRFCRNVQALSDTELLLYAPDFSIYEENTDPQELVQMYREHAKEVMHCFREKSTSQLRQVLASVLI